MPVIRSQGTKLFFVDPDSGLPVSVTCATGISGLGGAADQIDTTCLDNTTDRTYERGLGNPGQVTVPFNIHEGDVSHETLFALQASGETIGWRIYASSLGVAVPTVDSAGLLEPVSGVPSLGFEGYVSDVTVDIASNDIWKGTLVIQRSGSIDADLGTAS